MQILDRRLNPSGKSLENRQRFLRTLDRARHGALKRDGGYASHNCSDQTMLSRVSYISDAVEITRAAAE